MTTIALLCDSLQESSVESWLTINAAIQLARVCLSRKCRLIVYANSSVAIPVLLASSEYHKPAALESGKPYEQSTVFVQPFDIGNTSESSVESMFFSSSLEGRNEEGGLLNMLLYLSRSRSETEERPKGMSGIITTIEAAFEDLRPSVVIKLGMDARLKTALDVVASLRVKDRSIQCYADDGDDDSFKSIESVFDNKSEEFNWTNYFNLLEKEQRKFSEAESEQIRIAQKLARYSLAFELLIDRLRR